MAGAEWFYVQIYNPENLVSPQTGGAVGRSDTLCFVTPKQILAQLVLLSGRAGIGVRFDALGRNLSESRGGLCWLRGHPVVILDAASPVLDQIGVLAAALREFDLEVLYVPPLLRRRAG